MHYAAIPQPQDAQEKPNDEPFSGGRTTNGTVAFFVLTAMVALSLPVGKYDVVTYSQITDFFVIHSSQSELRSILLHTYTPSDHIFDIYRAACRNHSLVCLDTWNIFLVSRPSIAVKTSQLQTLCNTNLPWRVIKAYVQARR